MSEKRITDHEFMPSLSPNDAGCCYVLWGGARRGLFCGQPRSAHAPQPENAHKLDPESRLKRLCTEPLSFAVLLEHDGDSWQWVAVSHQHALAAQSDSPEGLRAEVDRVVRGTVATAEHLISGRVAEHQVDAATLEAAGASPRASANLASPTDSGCSSDSRASRLGRDDTGAIPVGPTISTSVVDSAQPEPAPAASEREKWKECARICVLPETPNGMHASAEEAVRDYFYPPDGARAARDRILALAASEKALREYAVCAFCGTQVPKQPLERVAEHMLACEHHPIRRLEVTIDDLRRELAEAQGKAAQECDAIAARIREDEKRADSRIVNNPGAVERRGQSIELPLVRRAAEIAAKRMVAEQCAAAIRALSTPAAKEGSEA